MIKKIFISAIICCMLQVMTIPCHGAIGSTTIPATGDVTSVIALALAGVAALGGLLLKRAK